MVVMVTDFEVALIVIIFHCCGRCGCCYGYCGCCSGHYGCHHGCHAHGGHHCEHHGRCDCSFGPVCDLHFHCCGHYAIKW